MDLLVKNMVLKFRVYNPYIDTLFEIDIDKLSLNDILKQIHEKFNLLVCNYAQTIKKYTILELYDIISYNEVYTDILNLDVSLYKKLKILQDIQNAY